MISFSGDLLKLYRDLDSQFAGWGAKWNADEFAFAPTIPAAELAKLDYFRSFPHLVTLPVTLDPATENLEAFAANSIDDSSGIRLTKISPIHDVLLPAACYPLYVQF